MGKGKEKRNAQMEIKICHAKLREATKKATATEQQKQTTAAAKCSKSIYKALS